MYLKSSMTPSGKEKQDNPVRIRISKRNNASFVQADEGAKKSMDIAEAFEHEKIMAQTYREKNQRNIMKCKFLYNKLTALGNLQGVPEMIAAEVSEVDLKIKEIEQMLFFKRSQQMRKLRKKVSNFLDQINFEIQAEDMEKIEDQIEIILFLIDIFEEKFNEMTAERKEIDDIIKRLEKDQESSVDLNGGSFKAENEKLLEKIHALEIQIEKLKADESKKMEVELSKRQIASDQSASEQIIGIKNLELQRQAKRINDLQYELSDIKAKIKLLEADVDRAKREQTRWKERYRLMEANKDERIHILEDSLSKIKLK